jgi:hypothetical protein
VFLENLPEIGYDLVCPVGAASAVTNRTDPQIPNEPKARGFAWIFA